MINIEDLFISQPALCAIASIDEFRGRWQGRGGIDETLAARLKEMGNYTLRVNTNGLADCITGRNAAPEMHGLLDIVSVSLNAPTAEKYDAVCHSKYGPEAFDAMLHFTAEAVKNVPHVVMTVVSTMPAEDIEACRKLCENAGAKFRVREYISE